MLVDMTATGELTRAARVVFAQKSAASAIALLGKSAVDRVIANFALGVSPVPVPTRFFTSESVALTWLREVSREDQG
jgi:phosphoglucomutase